MSLLRAACGFALAFVVVLGFRPAAADDLTYLKTPTGHRFAIMGDKPAAPAPTLINFATSPEATLPDPVYNKAGHLLAEQGWLNVCIDLPCHGQEVRPDEPAGLDGWAARLMAEENVMADLTTRARDMLDYLIQEGYTDPARVAVCGTSRGGFSALHFTAAEPRVAAVAALAPVTELPILREFFGLKDHALTNSLALSNRVPELTGRPVWICIGNNDDRVGTDACVSFARRLAIDAAAAGKPAPIELHVMQTEGHRTHPTAHDEIAAWIAARVPPPAEQVGDRACLFLDDRFIARSSGLRRVWHAARPAAEPAITAEHPWEAWPHLFGSVFHDPADSLYKMYYENYGGRNDFINTAYAESDDGRTWRKPALGLVEFAGSRDNNIVLQQAELANVFVDPRASDPADRLKMFVHFSYAGSDLGQGYTLLRSADGRRWERVGPGISPGYADPTEGNYTDTNVVMYDSLGDRYMADWRTFPLSHVAQNGNNRRRGIGISVSSDLHSGWSPAVTVLQADDEDDAQVARLATDAQLPDWAEMYVMPFWNYGNHYLGLVSLLYFIDGSDAHGGGDLQLTYSHDGLRWHRPRPRQSAVGRSNAAGLFPTYVSCSGPLELGDELWLYYTEGNGAHPKQPFSEAVSQIRAAVWRKDGFASLDTDNDVRGELTTRPLAVGGPRLLLNGVTNDGGSIRVALLTADGAPLPGFTLDDCQPLSGDFTAREVAWNGHTLAELTSTDAAELGVRLQLEISRGRLFAFRFAP